MSTPVPQALQLRDIHLPPAPQFWPPAPGWWIVAAVLLALLLWAGHAAWRRLRLRRQRRRILAVLAQLESGLARERSPQGLADISELLRRLALARFPHAQVAALSGQDWLGFLDDSGGQGRFADGPGRVLGSGPYQAALPPDLDIAGLLALVRAWVDRNSRSVA